MKDRHEIAWKSLVAAARRAPASDTAMEPGAVAPAGFATRVVARAGVGGALGGDAFGALFDRLAGRALGLAGACALGVAVWGSVPATAEAGVGEPGYATDAYLDPVGDYLAAVQST
jgi:hypothetical protein